jgi:hypothetical protein
VKNLFCFNLQISGKKLSRFFTNQILYSSAQLLKLKEEKSFRWEKVLPKTH